MQNEEIKKWISSLSLEPHPEGGFYKRVYESPLRVEVKNKTQRQAITSIYYLLAGSDFSTFHRLDADEIWHYYHGTSILILHVFNAQGQYQKIQLGTEVARFQAPVPAQSWFAAELKLKSKDDYALLGCTVSPGFEFQYFEMAEREALCQQYPSHKDLIFSLTR